ncbi:unnamed protein product [Caenorhabditis angaria]|uniref:Piwi domain-containing protein n=1 Tax=Caenorhabditis angaria TaxID=860376 RepID=A0A9P1ISP6_9PELO|nr:unnamed protein product [Caenorhabditis angaria]
MDLMDGILSTMDKNSPSAQFRIPNKIREPPPNIFKRNRQQENEPYSDVKRNKSADTFSTINCIAVQTNSYALKREKMVEKVERLEIDIYAVLKSNKTIRLNGEILVHGDLAIQCRKWGLWNVWKLLISQNSSDLFSGKSYKDGAYDCGSSIYFPAGTFVGGAVENVRLEREDFDDKKWSPIAKMLKSEIRSLKIRITRPKQDLIYTRGGQSVENAAELTRFLETLTSQITMGRDYFQFGNSTFNRSSDEDKHCQLDSDGKEIKTGFEKSVRLVAGVDVGKSEFVMTIDTRRCPFYQEMNVVDMLRIIYNISISDVIKQMRRDGPSQTSKKLCDLKSVAVYPTHLTTKKLNLFFIHDFSDQNAFECKFADESGKEMSVYDYFLDKYRIRLKYPDLPLAIQKIGNRVLCYPLEILKIERGQRVKQNNITAAIQQFMTGKMAMLPAKHIELASKILHEILKIDENPFLQAFGLEITRKPVEMIAKILPAPIIHFARNYKVEIQTGTMKRPIIDSKGGARFLRGAELREIWIINFDGVIRNDGCSRLSNAISDACKNQNIHISKRSGVWKMIDCAESDHQKLRNIMRDAKNNGVSMIFAVTREQRPDVHDFIKLYEAQIGVQTQHISFSTFRKMTGDFGGRQTTDNVIRKFNLKGGGLNFTFSIPRQVQSKQLCDNEKRVHDMLFGNTLFIGFELSHASATCLFDRQNNISCGEPSVVGYSYSLGDPCDLGGYSYLQKPREHSLMYIQKHMSMIVSNYELVKRTMPDKIVIYRSGVGEGDFERVEDEVREMKMVFERERKQVPEFLMIVVSKTSHLRIYPQNLSRNGTSFEQNVPSGTCLTAGITRYDRDEFYLVSQSALIGTIRPARYSIIVNDPKWTVNEISHMTYFLAFGHQVSFQPPAVPNVLYAAENMAKRGRNNFIAHQKSLRLERFANNRNDVKEDASGELIDNLSKMLNACAIQNKNYWA